jgi:hypothetical protein
MSAQEFYERFVVVDGVPVGFFFLVAIAMIVMGVRELARMRRNR